MQFKLPLNNALGFAKSKVKQFGNWIGTGIHNAWDYMTKGDGASAVSKLWNDFTGQTAIDKQLSGEKDLMQFQDNLNRQNLLDSATLQKQGLLSAGLNTALAYGGSVGGNSVGSVANHGAPLPMSGSEKLDKLLGSIQGMQGLMNNQYQLAANAESLKQKVIDTATKKQSFIGLLRKNYEAESISPFGIDSNLSGSKLKPWFGSSVVVDSSRLSKYQDSYWDNLVSKGRLSRENLFGKAYDNLYRYGNSDFFGSIAGNYGRGQAWIQKDFLAEQLDLLRRFGAADKYANYISKGFGALGNVSNMLFKGIPKLTKPKTYTRYTK